MISGKIENKWITQSNKLIESRYKLTLKEQKIILLMIAEIHPNDKDFKSYCFKIEDINKILGTQGNSLYNYMPVITEKLMSRVIKIKENDGLLHTHWVSSAKYINEKGQIELSFDPKLKPYLLQLKEQFTQYNLQIAVQFRSPYTIRIYTLLKQYESIGYRDFILIEFKEMLGISKEYQDFRNLKKRVINQAKKEFEEKTGVKHYKSDITFELETFRECRKIVKIRFVIIKQKSSKPSYLDNQEKTTTHKSSQLLAQAPKELISLIRKLVKEQGITSVEESYCYAIGQIEKVKGTDKAIANESAYINHCLNQGYGRLTSEQRKTEQLHKISQKLKQQLKEKKELLSFVEKTAEKQRKKQEVEKRKQLSKEQEKRFRQEFTQRLEQGKEGQIIQEQFSKQGFKMPGIKGMFTCYLNHQLLTTTEKENLENVAQEQGIDYLKLKQDIHTLENDLKKLTISC